MTATWPNACDCHMHIYDDSYPLAPTATFKPPQAPASAYREVQSELGLTAVCEVESHRIEAAYATLLVDIGHVVRAVVVLAIGSHSGTFECNRHACKSTLDTRADVGVDPPHAGLQPSCAQACFSGRYQRPDGSVR